MLSIAHHDDGQRIGDLLVVPPGGGVVGYASGRFGAEPLGPRSGVGGRQFELGVAHGVTTLVARHARVVTRVNDVVLQGARRLELGDRVEAGRTLLVFHERPQRIRAEAHEGSALVGVSRALTALREELVRLAPTPIRVLVCGESGVGKEVVAAELHRLSGRRGRHVGVNCRAIPETLEEAHILGWVRGAFSGATGDRPGIFEQAHGGTLFLDELGEATPTLQAKLLRVLEEGCVTRLGDSRVRPVDVRVVSATNRDLRTERAKGRFRKDLYARLVERPLEVPPLRERREDIPLLARALLTRAVAELGVPEPVIGLGLMRRLIAADWPLNARTLRSALRNLLVEQPGSARLAPHPVVDRLLEAADDGTPGPEVPRPVPPRFVSDDELRAVAVECGMNQSAIARRLSWNRRTVARRLRALGLLEPPRS